MGANFKLVSRSLIDVRCAAHRNAHLRWQRHWAITTAPGTLCCFNNSRGRLVDPNDSQTPEANANFLTLHNLLLHLRGNAWFKEQNREAQICNTDPARARIVVLLDNLCNHTCTDGTTAFANRETQTFFHRDRVDQVLTVMLTLSRA